MKRRQNIFRQLIIVILTLAFAVPTLHAQEAEDKSELAKTLIVKVNNGLKFGAGIIFNVKGEYLFIATARHVVEESENGFVDVEFKFARNITVKAKLIRNSERLDLAVLQVDLQDRRLQKIPLTNIPFELLQALPSLQKGMPVFPIGHPAGKDWYISRNPGIIQDVIFDADILFEFDCYPGHSGGGLFTESWSLAGMILQDDVYDCNALSFRRIYATLKDYWDLDVSQERITPIKRNTPTPTPVPTPSATEKKIRELLTKADAYFARQWYTTPEATSALPIYLEVLTLDPLNAYALEKIDWMADYYKNRAEKELKRGRKTQAVQIYRIYLTIMPNDEEVLDRLVELKATPTPFPTSASTQKPTATPKPMTTVPPKQKSTATPIQAATPIPIPTPSPMQTTTPGLLPSGNYGVYTTAPVSASKLKEIDAAMKPLNVVLKRQQIGTKQKQAYRVSLGYYKTKQKAEDWANQYLSPKKIDYYAYPVQGMYSLQLGVYKEKATIDIAYRRLYEQFPNWRLPLRTEVTMLNTKAYQLSIRGITEETAKQVQNVLFRLQVPSEIGGIAGIAAGQEYHDPVSGIDFVWIPEGCFQMGCVSGIGCSPDEKPVHEVCLDGFWLGKTEVTQAQWKQITGSNPSEFKGDTLPVENVSWNDTQDFLKKLNTKAEQALYRLPSESEWEYAARTGTETMYSFGNYTSKLREYAWYSENSEGQTHPVSQLKPNAWGLFDMYGNVWEWCQDWYDSEYYSSSPKGDQKEPSSFDLRVLRGGSWYNDLGGCRSACRHGNLPNHTNSANGLRVVVGGEVAWALP